MHLADLEKQAKKVGNSSSMKMNSSSEMIAKEEVIEKLHLKIKSLKKYTNNDFQTIQYLINKIDHLENRLNFAQTFSAIKTQHIDMLNDEMANS